MSLLTHTRSLCTETGEQELVIVVETGIVST